MWITVSIFVSVKNCMYYLSFFFCTHISAFVSKLLPFTANKDVYIILYNDVGLVS